MKRKIFCVFLMIVACTLTTINLGVVYGEEIEPVAFWKFDSIDSDVITDSSGNGYNLLVNSPDDMYVTLGYEDMTVGTDTDVDIGYIMDSAELFEELYGSSGITIEFMLKVKKLTTLSEAGTIFSIRDLNGNNLLMLKVCNNNGIYSLYAGIDAGSWKGVMLQIPANEEWHHMSVCFDYKNRKVYNIVNGVVITTMGNQSNFTDDGFSFNADNAGCVAVGGKDVLIDNLKIYDYLKNEEDIIGDILPLIKWNFDDYNNVGDDLFGMTADMHLEGSYNIETGLCGNALSHGNGIVRSSKKLSDGVSYGRGANGSVKIGVGGISAVAWVKLVKDANLYKQLISVKGKDGNECFAVGIENDGTVSFKASNVSGALYSYQAGNVVCDEKWHMIVCSADFKNKKMMICVDENKYQTEVNFNSNVFLSGILSENGIAIGNEYCIIDEVSIYRNTFSEVQKEKELGKSRTYQPLAWWGFDEEGETIVRDKGKFGIDGELINAVKTDESVYGKAITFDAEKKGYISLGRELSNNLYGAEGITISMWVQPKQLAATHNTGRLLTTYIGGSRVGIQLNQSAIKPSFLARSCYNESVLSSGVTTNYMLNSEEVYGAHYNNGIWYHLAAVFDYKNKLGKIYVNGKLLDRIDGIKNLAFSADEYLPSFSNYPDAIGGAENYDYGFCGIIDEVKVYNIALGEFEVEKLLKEFGVVKTERQNDEELISELKEQLNGDIVLRKGSSRVFIDGEIKYISDEHSFTPMFQDTIYLPKTFFEKYLGCSIELTARKVRLNNKKEYLRRNLIVNKDEVYLPIDDAVSMEGKFVHIVEDRLIIISNSDRCVLNEEKYITRLNEFFDEAQDMEREHNDSRVVVEYVPSESNAMVQAPTIVKLENGTILVSLSYYGETKNISKPAGTSIFASYDNGQTFSYLSNVRNVYTGSLVQIKGNVYLIGHNSSASAALSIAKSTDDGKTWTTPTDETNGCIMKGQVSNSHIGPTAVLVSNNRVYRAVEADVWSYGNFKTYMMSASVDSDLLNSENWTMTNMLTFNTDWITDKKTTNPGWLEGNPVVSPDGTILNILRVNSTPSKDLAAITVLSDDNSNLSFDENLGLIDFPGGNSMFVIHYDELSKKYIALVNTTDNTNNWYSMPRNVLELAVSDDLYNWKIVETLLIDDDMINKEESYIKHAFQYVNWCFDGNDIIAAVREASGDSLNYHNANYITFYRFENFRKYIDDAQYAVFLDSNINYYYDGAYYQDENPAFVTIDNKPMISVSVIKKLADIKYEYNSGNKMLNIIDDEECIMLAIGRNYCIHNGIKKYIASGPILYNGEIYVSAYNILPLLKWDIKRYDGYWVGYHYDEEEYIDNEFCAIIADNLN